MLYVCTCFFASSLTKALHYSSALSCMSTAIWIRKRLSNSFQLLFHFFILIIQRLLQVSLTAEAGMELSLELGDGRVSFLHGFLNGCQILLWLSDLLLKLWSSSWLQDCCSSLLVSHRHLLYTIPPSLTRAIVYTTSPQPPTNLPPTIHLPTGIAISQLKLLTHRWEFIWTSGRNSRRGLAVVEQGTHLSEHWY